MDEILTKIKSVLSNLCISGATVTWQVVRAVENGVLSAHCSEKNGVLSAPCSEKDGVLSAPCSEKNDVLSAPCSEKNG